MSQAAATLRLGPLQIDAFSIFVEGADACYEEGEAPPDDPPFPGRRCGALVTVDAGAERRAWRRLTDAANSADAEGWAEHRDALTALASRVGRMAGQAWKQGAGEQSTRVLEKLVDSLNGLG